MLWLLVGLVLALQPMLHVHPLVSDSGHEATSSAPDCVLCLHAHTDVARAASQIAAPVVDSRTFVIAGFRIASEGFTPSLPARAPPAA